MNSSRDPTARLRAGLNPLLTASLGVYHGSHTSNSTPLSAVSFSSTSQAAYSSAQTPVSALQPYNPQEWAGSLVPGADQRTRQFQEPQQSPLPPPPYSPPRSQRLAMNPIDAGQVANISASRAPLPQAVAAQRLSPDPPPANTSFPPPPGTRGASRERRFLPSFGRRREPESQTIQIPDPRQLPPTHSPAISSRPSLATHPGPLSIQIPERFDSDAPLNFAPSSRRAVSTPATSTPTSASARSRSSSQVRWDTTMSLPPPPSGPPPARSQSAQRQSAGSDPVASPPTRRPAPNGVTALGPVPPTPANWNETESPQEPQSGSHPQSPPLRETYVHQQEAAGMDSYNTQPDSAVSAASTNSAGLSRSRAVRGEKTLRERRNESRTRGGVQDSIDASLSDTTPLSDIVIPPASTSLARRLTISKGTLRSDRPGEAPRTGDASSSSGSSGTKGGSTPRASDAAQKENQTTPTPQFSPQPRKAQPTPDTLSTIAPRSLPTPPPQSRSSSRARPNLEVLVPTPMSSRSLSKQGVVSQSQDQFTCGTIERFQVFAKREAAATNDAERVRLFAEFFVSESRVRRERYNAAIGAMGSEIFDLTRDLFRPMGSRPESTTSIASAMEFTPQTSEPRSHRGSIGSTFSAQPGQSGSAPTSAGGMASSPSGPPTANVNWQSSNYMPSLSPILSMSVSDKLDEQDSRGRPASRWWEDTSSEGHLGRIERSKRESKYMGVPKEAREALQWADEPSSSTSKRDPSNEYPPEKVGQHNQDLFEHQVEHLTSTPRNLNRQSIISMPTPSTPSPAHLDVSRLVTLPPPYPRHHPAVNNNHPELAETRAAVRVLSDMAEVEATNEKFQVESAERRTAAAEAAKKRKTDLRKNLTAEIGSGNIGYAEAAAIEADAVTEANNQIVTLEKVDFDAFQTVVVVPLNELLQARINEATQLFDSIRARLFSEDPNLPQEQGDEQAELLEKLTLLKWVFEARESLHRAVHDLLTDRNNRYRDVVLTPYRVAGNMDKAASVIAFFQEDAGKRTLADAEEVLRRTQEFRDVVQEAVVRGVEVQLGAFWDLAPPLKRLLDKIPASLHRGGGDQEFGVQIPTSEIEENPAYVRHPMQYLFSLLLHAEKSTYQFIEAQTNLLCLLHEVREAVVTAKARVMELDGRDAARVEVVRKEETQRLTDDLQEKVRLVQQQWSEGLGECIGIVKERVGEWLLETGGWDESFEDGGVGAG